MTPAGRVLLLALASRAAVLSCMVLADLAFADLDSSSRLQDRPCDAAGSEQGCRDAGRTTASAAWIDHLGRWDTVHFVRIAKCGYETDMSNAFFPLLPLLMRTVASMPGLSSLLSEEAVLTLVGLAVSLASFCAAALALHRLTMAVLHDAQLADLSILLFCCNPASVFYSAAYTEALFAALTWTALLLLPGHPWAAVALLAAAGGARSNGILACWFLVHRLLAGWRQAGRLPWAAALGTAAGCAGILSPYVYHQAQAYWAFCDPKQPLPEWCSARLPSVYSYIQGRYWDVGLLRFYRDPRRLPMVLAALPVGFLSVYGCWTYFAADWLRALTLGLFRWGDPLPAGLHWLASCLPAPALQAGKAPQVQGRRRSARLAAAAAPPPRGTLECREEMGYLATAAAPYIYHWAFMTAFALLAMNVNVATRFLSVCPPFYWFTAHYLLGSNRSSSRGWPGGASSRRQGGSGGGWRAYWVWGWCLAYNALGCLLFPNFYPWV